MSPDNPLALATETANYQAGSESPLLSNLGNFGQAALFSGLASVYNTGAELLNKLGADAEKIDVARSLSENDESLGEYYRQNRNAIDVTGFIATSIIPGTLALKGLQLAKAGTLIGPYGRAFGYFSNQRTKHLNEALTELAQSGGSIFSQINANSLKAMAWGVADNVLSVAAFETAVAATMKQSPLLEKDDWTTVTGNIIKSSLAFGLLGGTLEAIAINSVYKGFSRVLEPEMRKYDRLVEVDKALDLPSGTKAYMLLDSMLQLPQEGKNIEYLHRFLPPKETLTLPTKEAFERAAQAATKRGWDEFSNLTNKMAAGDTELGGAFRHFVETRIGELQQSGTKNEDILDMLRGYLLNVNKLERVKPGAEKGFESVFYISKKLEPEKLVTIKSADDFLAAIITRAPTEQTLSRTPTTLIGDISSVKVAIVGNEPVVEGAFARFPFASEAYEAGYDAVIHGRTGLISINPTSKVLRPRTDPILQPRQYFNFQTGSFSYNAYPTIADFATSARPINLVGNKDVVTVGLQTPKRMKLEHDFNLKQIDTVSASARYAWLSFKDKSGDFAFSALPLKVKDTDLPMLERIYQEGAAKWKDIELVSPTGSTTKVGDLSDFGEFLLTQKLAILQKHLAENGPEDLLALGVKLNAEVSWLERAIASNFTASDHTIQGFSIKLERSQYPANMEIRWDFSGDIGISKNLVKAAGPTAEPTVFAGKEVKIPRKNAEHVFVQHLPDGAGNSIYGILGTEYAIKVAEQQNKNAVGAVLGANRIGRMVKLDANSAIRVADQRGAGPTVLGSTNADYGDPLRATFQYQGQLTNLWIKELSNATLDQFQPIMRRIQDSKEASAELGILTNVLRGTEERFIIHPENSRALVNVRAMVADENGLLTVSETKLRELKDSGVKTLLEMKTDEVVDMINLYRDTNRRWVGNRQTLLAARGIDQNWNPDIIHVPPVDTGRYPYFAFVRKKEGFVGGSSEVTMIVARDERGLRDLANSVPNDYDVIFNKQTKEFFKAKGDYDYQLTIKEPTINSDLQKRGVLASYFPEVRPENVLEDYIRHVQYQEARTVRLGVETYYAQTFAELRGLGRQFENLATSKFEADIKKFKSQVDNPFEEYIKMALDISKRSEYTLLHEMNEFAESLGRTAYQQFGTNKDKALAGMIPWEEANRIAERYGISGPYKNADEYIKANTPADRSLTKDFVAKANMFMVNFTLRLDMAQSIINVISTPILLSTEMASIRSLVAGDSALTGKLNELRSIKVPGEALAVPSTMKLLGNAIGNFWSPEKATLLQRYKDIGAIKDMLSKYHEMIDHFTIRPTQAVSKYKDAADKAVDIGAKFSGNTWAEEFTRFISADVMRQLTDPIVAAGKMSLPEQNAYIGIFVNRVQGNYLASQRPIAFQGVMGSAISLFQTYQFNLLQQLFRHVENQDKRALFTLFGMQGGIYGANGIPFFEAVNNHLVGQSSLNPAHRDAYSYVATGSTAITGATELGEWLMYGTASAFPFWPSKAPALYTRGDINPRHVTILPITPTDFVGVDGSIRLVKNLWDFGTKVLGGADKGVALLEALEHNGINRPLAGIAQLAAGRATTSKGGLISAANDWNAIATLSRVIGAKPMDESLALNTYFRLHGYQAADQERLETLGEIVKTKLKNNQLPAIEELREFQQKYAASGGRIENYGRAIQRWSIDANTSIVNKLIRQHASSYSKRMIEIMGGTTIADYRNQRSVATSFTLTEDDQAAASGEQR